MKYEMQVKIEKASKAKQERIAAKLCEMPCGAYDKHADIYDDILNAIGDDEAFLRAQDSADQRFLEYERGY